MGTQKEMETWIAAFPNVVFGIAGAHLRDETRKPAWKNAVLQMPLSKFVLETDAPFLLPPEYQQKVSTSNPGMVLAVAKLVADIRNLPLKLICKLTTRNACRLYQL